MTTLGDLVANTLVDYLHVTNSVRDSLAASVDISQNTVGLTYNNEAAQPGKRLSVGLEDMHIWLTSGDILTVERGSDASDPQVHTQGDIVLVNPRFSGAQAYRAINEEIRALSGEGLYTMHILDLLSSSTVASYDLTGMRDDVQDITEIHLDESGTVNDWPRVPHWTLRRDADETEFPSGLQLVVRDSLEAGRTLRVRYKGGFDTFGENDPPTVDDDVEATTGLWEQAHDLLSIGAAVRLMSGQEVPRSSLFAQGDTRRAQEVPPGAIVQSGTGLRELRRERIAEEKRRQRRENPYRVKVS